MRSSLSAVAAAVALMLLSTKLDADELVLELTTKLGVQKTVTVASVSPDTLGMLGSNPVNVSNLFGSPQFKSDKKYLVLSPSASKDAPNMVIWVPWANIKGIVGEKTTSTVTCLDGAKFNGTILTEVTSAGKLKYHMADCATLTVKEVTKSKKEEYAGPTAKCTLRLGELEQSFNARNLAYGTASGIPYPLWRFSDSFQMNVAKQKTGGNLSDFEKVSFGGSGSSGTGSNRIGSISIGVQTPRGKETKGELLTKDISAGALIFETPGGCAVILKLWDVARARKQSFAATIESTTAGEALPKRLFDPIWNEKKK